MMDNVKSPRMRTISQAAEYMKEQDNSTALTKTAIRRMVINGDIPFVKAGNKYLLSLETLSTYLTGGTAATEAVGGVRKIPERRC